MWVLYLMVLATINYCIGLHLLFMIMSCSYLSFLPFPKICFFVCVWHSNFIENLQPCYSTWFLCRTCVLLIFPLAQLAGNYNSVMKTIAGYCKLALFVQLMTDNSNPIFELFFEYIYFYRILSHMFRSLGSPTRTHT